MRHRNPSAKALEAALEAQQENIDHNAGNLLDYDYEQAPANNVPVPALAIGSFASYRYGAGTVAKNRNHFNAVAEVAGGANFTFTPFTPGNNPQPTTATMLPMSKRLLTIRKN